ncbi:MAG: hypothetical protein AAB490_01430 [Patescibacteria group bacterium]
MHGPQGVGHGADHPLVRSDVVEVRSPVLVRHVLHAGLDRLQPLQVAEHGRTSRRWYVDEMILGYFDL